MAPQASKFLFFCAMSQAQLQPLEGTLQIPCWTPPLLLPLDMDLGALVAPMSALVLGLVMAWADGVAARTGAEAHRGGPHAGRCGVMGVRAPQQVHHAAAAAAKLSVWLWRLEWG